MKGRYYEQKSIFRRSYLYGNNRVGLDHLHNNSGVNAVV